MSGTIQQLSESRLRESEQAIVDGLHSAGRHYYDWLIGDPQITKALIRENLVRPDSEIYYERLRIHTEANAVLGGYVSLTGAELDACKIPDLYAIVKVVPFSSDPAFKERLQLLRRLFPPPIPADAYVGSRVWASTDPGRRNVGRLLLDDMVEQGRQKGFSQLHGYVARDNISMLLRIQAMGYTVSDSRLSPDDDGPEYLLATLNL